MITFDDENPLLGKYFRPTVLNLGHMLELFWKLLKKSHFPSCITYQLNKTLQS